MSRAKKGGARSFPSREYRVYAALLLDAGPSNG